jgi:hypothetical protein
MGGDRIIGQRFHIYASKGSGVRVQGSGKKIWSGDLAIPRDELPAWMIELAEQVGMIEPDALAGLPTGVIVGSAVIEKCVEHGALLPDPSSSLTSCLRGSVPPCLYQWHLADIQRARKLRKPSRHPQPMWFNPFD